MPPVSPDLSVPLFESPMPAAAGIGTVPVAPTPFGAVLDASSAGGRAAQDIPLPAAAVAQVAVMAPLSDIARPAAAMAVPVPPTLVSELLADSGLADAEPSVATPPATFPVVMVPAPAAPSVASAPALPASEPAPAQADDRTASLPPATPWSRTTAQPVEPAGPTAERESDAWQRQRELIAGDGSITALMASLMVVAPVLAVYPSILTEAAPPSTGPIPLTAAVPAAAAVPATTAHASAPVGPAMAVQVPAASAPAAPVADPVAISPVATDAVVPSPPPRVPAASDHPLGKASDSPVLPDAAPQPQRPTEEAAVTVDAIAGDAPLPSPPEAPAPEEQAFTWTPHQLAARSLMASAFPADPAPSQTIAASAPGPAPTRAPPTVAPSTTPSIAIAAAAPAVTAKASAPPAITADAKPVPEGVSPAWHPLPGGAAAPVVSVPPAPSPPHASEGGRLRALPMSDDDAVPPSPITGGERMETAAVTAAPSAPPPASGHAAIQPPAMPAVPPNPMERMVVHQVARGIVRRDADGDRRLVIRLTPPELGTVRIEFAERDGVLTARLHADDPAVRQTLDRLLPHLRDHLRAADAPVQQITVESGSRADQGFDGRGFDGRGQQPRHEPGHAGRARRGERSLFSLDGMAIEETATSAPRQRIPAAPAGAVDILA